MGLNLITPRAKRRREYRREQERESKDKYSRKKMKSDIRVWLTLVSMWFWSSSPGSTAWLLLPASTLAGMLGSGVPSNRNSTSNTCTSSPSWHHMLYNTQMLHFSLDKIKVAVSFECKQKYYSANSCACYFRATNLTTSFDQKTKSPNTLYTNIRLLHCGKHSHESSLVSKKSSLVSKNYCHIWQTESKAEREHPLYRDKLVLGRF